MPIVWGGSYDSDILKLENIHLDAMRLVPGATASFNIIYVHEEFGGYTVSNHIKYFNFSHAVQGC